MSASKIFHCAAIDLGASSGRVIVGTWSSNRLKLKEVHRFPNSFQSIGEHDYWNLPALWAHVQEGLRRAAREFPKLSSVGVDTWGVDYVMLNDSGRLVFPTHAYRDARTKSGWSRLAHTRAALARIYAATGIPNVFYNTSLQLAETVAQCPAIEDLATRCLLLPDYFNYLLSGRMENELSIASTTQLLDVHSSGWSRATLDHFRIPAQWFTAPVPAGTKLGRIKKFPALAKAQVIAVPGHDTAAAFDAMPADPAGGDLYISSGTWSLVGFESNQPVLGAEALATCISNERTGDGRYRPLINVAGLWLLEQILKQFATKISTASDWARLIRAAENLPTPRVLLDVRDPTLINPSSMRAAIDAQLKKKGVRPPTQLVGYARLIFASVARGHADAKDSFERLAGRKFDRILMVGGGSKNRLLCQGTADYAGIPVVSFALEGAAVGNIASQLVALGALKNLASFREHLADGLMRKVYQPRT